MDANPSGLNPIGSRTRALGSPRPHRRGCQPGTIDCSHAGPPPAIDRLTHTRDVTPSQHAVVLAVLLASVLLLLVPVANGSPPDPLWISGYYDGADYDNVVDAISGGIYAANGSGAVESDRPIWIEHRFTVRRWSPIAPASALECPGSRAPPRSVL